MNTKLLDDSQTKVDAPMIGPYEMKWDDIHQHRAVFEMNDIVFVLFKEGEEDNVIWSMNIESNARWFGRKLIRTRKKEDTLSKTWHWINSMANNTSDPFTTGITYQTLSRLIDLMGDRCPECEVFWGSSHRSDCDYNFLEKNVRDLARQVVSERLGSVDLPVGIERELTARIANDNLSQDGARRDPALGREAQETNSRP